MMFFIQAGQQVFPVMADTLANAQTAVTSVNGIVAGRQNPLFNGHAFSLAEAEATGFLG